MALKKLNEFRYHNIRAKENRESNGKNKKKKRPIRHPTFIFGINNKEYYYRDISHSDKVPDKTYIKLEKNPNPKDKDPSYINSVSDRDNRSNFGKRLKGWSLSKSDKEKYSK